MSIRRTIVAITVVVTATACGTDAGDPTSASAPSESPPSESPTSESPPSDAPESPQSTTGQTAKNSGEWDLVLTDVRVAEHESFDRIVLEFTGTGTPGWSVNYVDEAVLDGSGRVVKLGGDAVLDIYASGTTYPASEADDYAGPQRFQPENGGGVHEVYVGGTFEGYTQVLVGIDGDPVPFRVFALTKPSRLVVDVGGDSPGGVPS